MFNKKISRWRFFYFAGSAASRPFFFSVRIACVDNTIVTFWPLTVKVFFCRFGLNTRLVRRKEKLTLWPNCLPLPVSSHLDAITLPLLYLTICTSLLFFTSFVNI